MHRNGESCVLVIDDDQHVRELLRVVLDREGHRVVCAQDGREGLRLAYSERPDVVVLDIDMPALDGWAVLERLRDISEVPVLMLTASAGELEKVRALRAGADDYVTKPFGVAELAARVEALLRRARGLREAQEVHDDGLVRIDVPRREVEVGGTAVALTPLEFKLLCAFVRHPGQVLSRDQLLDLVWGGDFGSGDQVRLYVGYLRRKLETALPDAPIETVRGFGYRYAPAAVSRPA